MIRRNRAYFRLGFTGFAVLLCVAIALTTPASGGLKTQKPGKQTLLEGSSVPPPVRAILERACQDCHSGNTSWPWYSHIPPISRRIHKDVDKGRAFMDLSKWNSYTEGQRRGFRVAIGAAIEGQLMPPAKYVWMHRKARLSNDELSVVKAWAFGKPVLR